MMLQRLSIFIFLILANSGLYSKEKNRPVIGLGYVDVGLSKSHFDWKIFDQNANTWSDTAFSHYNTTMLDWRAGGSLLAIILNRKIQNWFIGDASEVSVAGGYGRAIERRLNTSDVRTEGTVALGVNIRWGVIGFYRLQKDILVGAKYQWILQQEFLAYVLSGDYVNPHRKQLSMFATFKNTTAELSLSTAYKLTKEGASETTYNNSGFSFALKQRLGGKFYCGLAAERVHLRYETDKPWINNLANITRNEWWRGLISIGIGF